MDLGLTLRFGLRLLHVDSDPHWIKTVAVLARSWTEVLHVGAAHTGAKALTMLRALAPDVVLFDASLSDMDGFGLAKRLRELRPRVRLLLFTRRCDDAALYRMNRGPLDGAIWKTDTAEIHLRPALAAMAAGQTYFPIEVEDAKARFRVSPDAFFKIFSELELDLVRRFGRGDTNARIATELGIRKSTVKWHRYQIMRRLGLHRTAELMRWADDRGLVEHLLPAPPCVMAE